MARRRVLGAALCAAPAVLLPAEPATARPVTVDPGNVAARNDVLDNVVENRVGPRMLDLTVHSRVVGRTVGVRLLTPPHWSPRRTGARWPVLYLLHGGFEPEGYRTWTAETGIAGWPQLRDVLVVMPDGGQTGFYSDWWNGGRGGPPAWETFHLGELRLLLERRYGAGGRRAVAGLSMGGFGAVHYAARHPGLFRAAASFSGPVHLLHPAFQQVWPQLVAIAAGVGEDLTAVWGDPVAQRRVWQAHDPYRLAHRLRTTAVFLSSGDGNPGPLDGDTSFDPAEAVLRQLNESLAARLRFLGSSPVTHFHVGTHHPAYGEDGLRRSLPVLRAALGLPARLRP